MLSKKHNSQNRQLKSFLFCVFSFAFTFLCKAQFFNNLINNYSFEQYGNCPNNYDQISEANYWFKGTIAGTVDYINSCSSNTAIGIPSNTYGFQIPKTGNAYAGIVTCMVPPTVYPNAREYLETGLKKTLDNNKQYCVTFYVSLGENLRIASNNIGFLFSNDSIREYTPAWPPYTLTYTPTYENGNLIADTLNWTEIQVTYTANGTEKFITIGNFKNDAATTYTPTKPFISGNGYNVAYYFIDDVSIVEINPANAGLPSYTIDCVNDSVILGTDSTEFATYSWLPTTGLSCTNCPNPTAKPSTTTKYYLTKQQCSSTTIDSVIVSILSPTTPANAGSDKTICAGESALLGTDSIANIFYNWQEAVAGGSSLSCTNCPHPTAQPDSSTYYILQRQECSFISYDTVKVFIDDCDPTFTVPTVFTPNNDDVNDTWGIKFSSIGHIKNFSVNVYDRWGLLVFSSNPESTFAKASADKPSMPNIKWDGHTVSGQPCSEGTYFYIITFTKNDEVQRLKGTVGLFR